MIDWQMRRTRWLLAGIGLLLLAGVMLGLASRRCEVVVYNESAEVRAGILVTSAGFQWRVKSMDPGQSRSTEVSAIQPGDAWVVHTGRVAEGVGESWFEPGPGRRLVIRVWPDGSIDFDAVTAWWE